MRLWKDLDEIFPKPYLSLRIGSEIRLITINRRGIILNVTSSTVYHHVMVLPTRDRVLMSCNDAIVIMSSYHDQTYAGTPFSTSHAGTWYHSVRECNDHVNININTIKSLHFRTYLQTTRFTLSCWA